MSHWLYALHVDLFQLLYIADDSGQLRAEFFLFLRTQRQPCQNAKTVEIDFLFLFFHQTSLGVDEADAGKQEVFLGNDARGSDSTP